MTQTTPADGHSTFPAKGPSLRPENGRSLWTPRRCGTFPAPPTLVRGMFTAIIIWLVLAIVIGVAAARRGRSGLGWLFVSLILSPLVAALLLALLPDRRYEEVLSQLAAHNAAAATTRDSTRERLAERT
jgi:hypothetical protein